jgi:transcription-repair coupling factor (superfamily II helicase)
LPVTTPTVTIDLPVPAYIPTTYVGEPSLRIQLYRRLAEINSLERLQEMREELTDRFGPLPRAVQGLLFQIEVKLLAQRAGASAVAAEGNQLAIRLPYLAAVDRSALQQLLGEDTRVSRTAVWFAYATHSEEAWQDRLREILDCLGAARSRAEQIPHLSPSAG